MTERRPQNIPQSEAPTVGGPGAWVRPRPDAKWSLSEIGLQRVRLSPFEQHILDLRKEAGLDTRPYFDGAGRPILHWNGSANGKDFSAYYEQGAASRECTIPGNRIEVRDYDYLRHSVGKVGSGLLLFGLSMHDKSPEQSAELMRPFVGEEASKDPKVQGYVKAFLPTFGLYPYLDSVDATVHLSDEGHGRGLGQLTVDDLLGEWLQSEKGLFIREDRMKGRKAVIALLKFFEGGSDYDRVWKNVNQQSMAILREGATVLRRDFSGRYLQGDPSREARAGMWKPPVITIPPGAIA